MDFVSKVKVNLDTNCKEMPSLADLLSLLKCVREPSVCDTCCSVA